MKKYYQISDGICIIIVYDYPLVHELEKLNIVISIMIRLGISNNSRSVVVKIMQDIMNAHDRQWYII